MTEVLREEGKVAMSGAFFEIESATLNSSAPQILFKLSKAMETFPKMRLAIVGRTDSVGDFNYNVDCHSAAPRQSATRVWVNSIKSPKNALLPWGLVRSNRSRRTCL